MNDDPTVYTEITDDIFTAPYQLELYNYWLGVKKQRNMPARSDINIEHLKKYLSTIMIIDVCNNGEVFKVRLFGTKCVSVYGEFTGRTMNDFEEFDNAVQRLVWGVQYKKPSYTIKNLGNIHKEFINTSFIVLPLSNDGETVSQFIVSHHFY